MTKARRTFVLSLSLVLAAGAVPAQTPLGMSFTYQGRLSDVAGPANGPYDFELRLFAAASGGVAVGPTVAKDDVPVTEGLFTVGLDFGPAAFAGQARWLEIAVRPGASTGSYATLAPRQELTASPNALWSVAAPWAGLAGVPAGFADGIDNDSGGDITSVTAGSGLAGGATQGDATLAVDTGAIQARVTGACPSGQSIRTINQNGTVVCELDDVGSGWGLTGNAGTNPGTDFIGTTDAQPLVLRANGTVAFRLSRGSVLPNVIGGSTQNVVSAGVDGATIAGGGGGTADGANKVTDQYGFVGGGYGNVAGNDSGTVGDAQFASVGGGIDNSASGTHSTVGGGNGNVASGAVAVIGGGTLNTASGEDSVAAGGEGNVASGTSASVPGGFQNVAGGGSSLAAGFRARVRDAAGSGDPDGDEGTFVWADSAPPFGPFVSTGPNQFLIRAGGGVGVNTNAPAFPLDVDGVIRSRTGGFRFPDGTTQTTAATGTGDITAVNTPGGGGLQGGVATGDASLALLGCADTQILKRVAGSWTCVADSTGTVTSVTAGTGLTGGTITTTGTLGVAFSGTGAATTVARGDHDHDASYAATAHDHMGETWSAASPVGLRLQNSALTSRTLWVDNSAVNGVGVFASATGTAGGVTGVYGEAGSPNGRGVTGWVTSTSGPASGVYGLTFSPIGIGVGGFNVASTGVASGVQGYSDSTAGRGVYGIATSTSGPSRGVWGTTASTEGYGVLGWATATTGPAIGVYGTSNSSQGTGVLGFGLSQGVWAISNATHGLGLFAQSTATTGFGGGVRGDASSTSGIGVHGIAFATTGGNAVGVRGESSSSSGKGVFGWAFSSLGSASGVQGFSSGINGTGVEGLALANAAPSAQRGVSGEVVSNWFEAYAVAGFAPSGAYAGHFSGRVHVNGSLSKASGSFKIDHPLDPANKYLYHSFVESPDMKNIYDGLVTTDGDGFATVAMPDWFSALNRDFRYQLTVIGKGVWAQARVYEPLADGRFVIQTDRPDVQVSWQVTGIRQDAYAERNRIPVEEDKPEKLRGKYLHPEEWGQPEEAGIEYERLPSRRRGMADLSPPATAPRPVEPPLAPPN